MPGSDSSNFGDRMIFMQAGLVPVLVIHGDFHHNVGWFKCKRMGHFRSRFIVTSSEETDDKVA